MAFGNPICCPAVTYNRENLKNFYFDEGMRVSLDWYAWYKISEHKGRFAYVSDKLMCHRIHGESETSKRLQTIRVVKKIYTCMNSSGLNGWPSC